MLIYVLDPWGYVWFDRVAVIEEYESCIWNERWIVPGDFKLVVSADHENSKLLRKGVLLENDESEYPMYIETVEAQNGFVTATGKTVEAFFDERSLGPRTKTDSPGRIMGALVDDMQSEFDENFQIEGIRAGDVQADGDDVTEKIEERTGVHSLLLSIGQKHRIDMYVRRVWDEWDSNVELVFSTRKGVDRTTDNDDNLPVVRFSPQDDNFTNVREIISAVDDIAAVIVHVPDRFVKLGTPWDEIPPHTYPGDNEFGLWDLGLPPFQTRTKEVDSSRLTVTYLKKQIPRYYSAPYPTWQSLDTSGRMNLLVDEMLRLAEATYRKHKQKLNQAIDGEVSENVYKYGVDYRLGDIVEIETYLEDGTADERKARVIEYIRSYDAAGKRAYPTLSPPSESAEYSDPPPAEDDSWVQFTEDMFIDDITIIDNASYRIKDGRAEFCGRLYYQPVSPYPELLNLFATGKGLPTEFEPLEEDEALVVCHLDTWNTGLDRVPVRRDHNGNWVEDGDLNGGVTIQFRVFRQTGDNLVEMQASTRPVSGGTGLLRRFVGTPSGTPGYYSGIPSGSMMMLEGISWAVKDGG